MKVLFAVSDDEISEAIVKEYKEKYKEIITYKNVYYFNAIIKEIERDQTYDRIVISEELEPFTNNNYDAIDKFMFEKLDNISDEITRNTSIVLICIDRRAKGEPLLSKLFGIGLYNALMGNDRNIPEVCRLLRTPRSKKEAKIYYGLGNDEIEYQKETENSVTETEIQNILAHYRRLGKNEEKYIDSFNNIAAQYNDTQLRLIIKYLPLNVKAVLETQSEKYQSVMTFSESAYQEQKKKTEEKKRNTLKMGFIESNEGKNKLSSPVIVPSAMNKDGVKKLGKKKVQSAKQIEEPEEKRLETKKERKTIDEQEKQRLIEKKKKEKDIVKKQALEKNEVDSKKIKKKLTDSNVESKVPKSKTAKRTIIKEIEPEEIKPVEIPPIVEKKEIEQINEEPPKRKRGRPRKPVDPEAEVKPKRGRGRPRKNPIVEEEKAEEVHEEDDDILKIVKEDDELINALKKPKETEELLQDLNEDNDDLLDFSEVNEEDDDDLLDFDEEDEEDEDDSLDFDEEDEDGEDDLLDFDEEDEEDEDDLLDFDEDEDDEDDLLDFDEEDEEDEDDLLDFDEDEEDEEDEDDLLDFDEDEEDEEDEDDSLDFDEEDEEDEDDSLDFDEEDEEDEDDLLDLDEEDEDDEDDLLDFEEDDEDDEDDLLDFDEDEDDEDDLLDFEEEDEDDEDDLLDFDEEDEEDEDDSLDFDDDDEEDEEENDELPEYEEDEDDLLDLNNKQNANNKSSEFDSRQDNMLKKTSNRVIDNQFNQNNNKINLETADFSNILTSDKKIVAFIGTSKNGTSFLVNNLAMILSEMGVKTAILDLTKNKNSYYIFTKNEEDLRKLAYSSFDNLKRGIAQGINVNRNLSVYTSLPGENNNMEDINSIMPTLIRNYSVVLLDCDFETPINYFAASQEIYIVQSMDILTIQPLTYFLKELKNVGIDLDRKARIIINKEQKVKNLSKNAIIGGISSYNDPAMSYMTKLFDKDKIINYSIPLDIEAGSKYLETLVTCELSLAGYPKSFIENLKRIAVVINPAKKGGYQKNSNNGYSANNKFSNNMNSTLDEMKRKY